MLIPTLGSMFGPTLGIDVWSNFSNRCYFQLSLRRCNFQPLNPCCLHLLESTFLASLRIDIKIWMCVMSWKQKLQCVQMHDALPLGNVEGSTQTCVGKRFKWIVHVLWHRQRQTSFPSKRHQMPSGPCSTDTSNDSHRYRQESQIFNEIVRSGQNIGVWPMCQGLGMVCHKLRYLRNTHTHTHTHTRCARRGDARREWRARQPSCWRRTEETTETEKETEGNRRRRRRQKKQKE